MTTTRLNPCLGSHSPSYPTQGGASWTNTGICPMCGKRVAITKSGHLRTHGTRSKEKPEAKTQPTPE